MILDERTLRLIAVGASVSANCQLCLEVNVTRAVDHGATEQEIADAIQVGRMVRKGAAGKMDAFIPSVHRAAAPSDPVPAGPCDCDR